MSIYNIVDITIKFIILISILNVWLINRKSSSRWRGGGANSLAEEFQHYGLSSTVMYLVGFIKISLALILFISAFYMTETLESIGAYGMAFMMLGAIIMHIKIADPVSRSLPAFIFLVLSLATLYV